MTEETEIRTGLALEEDIRGHIFTIRGAQVMLDMGSGLNVEIGKNSKVLGYEVYRV